MANRKADEERLNKSWNDFCQMREAMGKPLRDKRDRNCIQHMLIQYSGGDIGLMADILDEAVENRLASVLPLYSSRARTIKELAKGIANTLSL